MDNMDVFLQLKYSIAQTFTNLENFRYSIEQDSKTNSSESLYSYFSDLAVKYKAISIQIRDLLSKAMLYFHEHIKPVFKLRSSIKKLKQHNKLFEELQSRFIQLQYPKFAPKAYQQGLYEIARRKKFKGWFNDQIIQVNEWIKLTFSKEEEKRNLFISRYGRYFPLKLASELREKPPDWMIQLPEFDKLPAISSPTLNEIEEIDYNPLVDCSSSSFTIENEKKIKDLQFELQKVTESLSMIKDENYSLKEALFLKEKLILDKEQSLSSNSNEIQKANQNIEELKQKLYENEKTLEKLKIENEKEKNKTQTIQSTIEVEKKTLQDENNELKLKNEYLLNEIENIKKTMENSLEQSKLVENESENENKLLQDENNKLKAKNENLLLEIENIKKTMENSLEQSKLLENNKIQQIQLENENLNKKIEILNEEKEKLENHKNQQIENERILKNNLQNALDNIKKVFDEEKQTLVHTSEKIKSFEDQLKTTNQLLTNERKENENLLQQLENKKNENEKLKIQMNEIQNDFKENQIQITKKYDLEITLLNEKLIQLNDELHKSSKEMNQFKIENQSLIKLNEESKQFLEERNKQIEKLKSDLFTKSYVNDENEYKQKILSLENYIEKLKFDNENLISKSREINDSLSAHQYQVREAADAVNEKDQQIHRMQEHFQNIIKNKQFEISAKLDEINSLKNMISSKVDEIKRLDSLNTALKENYNQNSSQLNELEDTIQKQKDIIFQYESSHQFRQLIRQIFTNFPDDLHLDQNVICIPRGDDYFIACKNPEKDYFISSECLEQFIQ